MNDYIEARIELTPYPGDDATDLLAGLLGDIGFESFVPDATNGSLTAYCPAESFDSNNFKEVLEEFPFNGCTLAAETSLVEGRDWNEEWEKNYFKPIVVGNRCVVHSSFHTDVPVAEYDIVIDPKMAFGTGHHATTSLILSQLLDMELEQKSVIDMGTGSAILAILSAIKGAHPVTGIEIDPFAYANAIENVALNNHSEITLINGDASALDDVKPADIFLANINRNVITADISAYASHLKHGGIMLLSGFYTDDIPVVTEAAEAAGIIADSFTERDHWACLKLHRPCAD
ncbi:MAG: 50S ribosomal protein L11 methyltransferase [Odoribacter sp.]|nr:50S ribosomal protein L11 methyltransferase [Odoribacter sp.]